MARVPAGGHVRRALTAAAATRAADRTPVIFAADAPVTLEHYAPVIEQLAAGRPAVAIELPGFGFSTPARSYRFTLGEQVDALIATLDALAIERATLAFSCVNALIAIAAAAPAELTAGRTGARIDRVRRRSP
jgi:pimeloyl-ACP methyl ester carboxylesterase